MMRVMQAVRILAIAALLNGAAAHAQGMVKPDSAAKKGQKAKLGASKDDGRGRSVANDQQAVEADKFKMRQDKANKDARKYKQHERQMQKDQEQVNRDNARR